jgi:hypothetical protein
MDSGKRKSSGLPPQTERVAQVMDDLLFCPSPDQRQVKAAFWAKYQQTPLISVDKVTASFVQKLIPDSRLPRWWSMYGFKEWFLNEDEFRQRLEYIAHLGLDALEAILTDPDANHNARVNAAKLAFEAASKMPQKWQKSLYLDDHIQKMDQAQLEQFIRQKSLGMAEQNSEEHSDHEKEPEEESSPE